MYIPTQPTWIRFSGLPGCGKTTLINSVIDTLTLDGWEIFRLSENLFSRENLKAFHKNPGLNAYQLQAEAIEELLKRTVVLRSKLLARTNHKILVIDQTPFEYLTLFTSAFEHLGFLSSHGANTLYGQIAKLKYTIVNMRSEMRQIRVFYHNLIVPTMIRNVMTREPNPLTYDQTLMHKIFAEVEYLRINVEMVENRTFKIPDVVLYIKYEENCIPTDNLLNAITKKNSKGYMFAKKEDFIQPPIENELL